MEARAFLVGVEHAVRQRYCDAGKAVARSFFLFIQKDSALLIDLAANNLCQAIRTASASAGVGKLQPGFLGCVEQPLPRLYFDGAGAAVR